MENAQAPIHAVYSDRQAVERAVSSLREAGVDPRDIVVLSSEPLEEYAWGRPGRPTRMGWFAALGGLLGGMSGYLLTSFTQQAYPLLTGAMPLVTGWTNGIIIYELTMLGIILATLLTLLVSAGLPDWRSQPYDPEVADGKILVGAVNIPEARRGELETRLRQATAGPGDSQQERNP